MHNNLGWKIHIVDPGYISEHNSDGQVNGAKPSSFSFLALTASYFYLFTVFYLSAISIQAKGYVF